MKSTACLLCICALAICGCMTQTEPPCGTESVRTKQIPVFFTENNITEVRYVRVAAYIADPKPVKILGIGNLDNWQIELLNKADVGSWKNEYNDDLICDGMRWVMEFISNGKVVKRVDGFNAEPEGLKYILKACVGEN